MRNQRIDIIRIFAAISVVLMHVMWPGETGRIVQACASWGVPFFFLIAGYYAANKTTDKLYRSAVASGKLVLLGTMVYFVWELITQHDIRSIKVWVTGLVTMQTVKEFLLYNWIPLRGHLWFLPALMYCHILYIIIKKFNLESIARCIAPLILFFNLMIGEIGGGKTTYCFATH